MFSYCLNTQNYSQPDLFDIIIGKETIVDITRVLPIRGRWALLANDSYWIPISMDICEFSKIYNYALNTREPRIHSNLACNSYIYTN